MVMVTEVFGCGPSFVLAIGCHRCPTELQRHQYQQKNHKQATHGQDCSSYSVLVEGPDSVSCRSEFVRSKRKPLNTTSRLAPISANTAIHIVALPNTASTRNTALIPNANAMFCHSVGQMRMSDHTQVRFSTGLGYPSDS